MPLSGFGAERESIIQIERSWIARMIEIAASSNARSKFDAVQDIA
jgi:hypothetical protein